MTSLHSNRSATETLMKFTATTHKKSRIWGCLYKASRNEKGNSGSSKVRRILVFPEIWNCNRRIPNWRSSPGERNAKKMAKKKVISVKPSSGEAGNLRREKTFHPGNQTALWHFPQSFLNTRTKLHTIFLVNVTGGCSMVRAAASLLV